MLHCIFHDGIKLVTPAAAAAVAGFEPEIYHTNDPVNWRLLLPLLFSTEVHFDSCSVLKIPIAAVVQ